MAWSYKREEQKFPIVPEGPHRIRIKAADKAISQKGNDMLALQFTVSGSGLTLFNYITFLDDRPEITNRMLTSFFDAFPDIEEGDFNMQNWIGKVGACNVKHEDYNGSPSAKSNYFIKSSRQSELPPWVEPEVGDNSGGNGFTDKSVEDEDIPFE